MESIYFKKFMNLEKFKKTIDSFLKYDSGWYVSENICLDVLSTDNLFEVRGGEVSLPGLLRWNKYMRNQQKQAGLMYMNVRKSFQFFQIY